MDNGVRAALGLQTLPRGAAFRKNLVLTALFTLLFIVVYGGADLLSANAEERYQLAFEFEAHLPFVPGMAFVYLSILPLMLLSPLVLETPRKLFPLFVVLSLEVLVAGVCFLLFPMQEIFPPRSDEVGNTVIFFIADTLNLRYNDLPSLHVGLSLTTAIALSQQGRAWGRWFYVVWGVLITISSVLMHEHHIADVVAGSALALAGVYWVYPRVSSPAFVRAARIEYICLAQFGMFIRRHRRYLVIAVFLYAHSLFRWRKTRVLRVGFCLLQAVDDLLDGDRPATTDPRVVALDIARQLEDGDFATDHLSALAESLAEDLRPLQTTAEDPLAEVSALIHHMAIDRQRVEQGLVFNAEELRRHHRTTFSHSLNLLLTAAGSSTRADDVPELVDAFGWCSTVRDLEDDLEQGLVNVPADVVAAAQHEGASVIDVRQFVATEAVRRWFAAELERAEALLEAHGRRRPASDDPTGQRILRIFDRSIGAYVRRFENMSVPFPARHPHTKKSPPPDG
ncbi:MAG: phosphatidic acid phosphatase [Woeseiaceae bacterium]|nr:phosphatidic acid phosphatase [Woeseiaceae bacterium]